MDKSIFRF